MKRQFLSNLDNMQRFIDLLESCGFDCLATRDDADVLICETAVTICNNKQYVTVVGDGTDLLVILLHIIKNSDSQLKSFQSTKTPLTSS